MGARYRSVGDFGTAPVLELGLGYAAAPVVRLEVVAEYRPRFTFKGRANFSGDRTPAIGLPRICRRCRRCSRSMST